MRKNMKLALLLMATGLILVTAAFFITSCGDLPEAGEKDPVVTFDANGGKVNNKPIDTKTVPKGEKVANPGTPSSPTGSAGSEPEPTKAGFYKKVVTGTGSPTPYSFGGWKVKGDENGANYDWNTPVTESITLVAKWNGGTGGAVTTYPSKADELSSGDGDLLNQVVAYLNKTATPTAADDEYFLVLDNGFTTTKQVLMEKGNLKISKSVTKDIDITSFNPGTGTSTNNSLVAFLIGPATPPASGYVPPKLTLYKVRLRGLCEFTTAKDPNDNTKDIPTLTGPAVGDSLVRVRYGATLILDEEVSISGHKNGATGSNGTTGNGSAVCVSNGGILTMKTGSIIECNEATGSGTNKNLVAGIYTIIYPSTVAEPYKTVTLNIEGGQVTTNKVTDGQTMDIYATEGGKFKLSGAVKINEITINADSASKTSTTTSDTDIVYTDIEVSGLGSEAYVNLSLRSTSTTNIVGDIWMKNNAVPILKGPSTATIASGDLAKFKLKEFKFNGGNGSIPATYSIDATGKLAKQP